MSGPPPREFLRREPAAEAGNAGAADPLGLRGIDFADHAVLDVFHHRLRFRARAVVEIEEHFLAGLLRGGNEHFHFLGVHRRRLLTEDMLARLEALKRERRVKFIRNDDAHGLDLGTASSMASTDSYDLAMPCFSPPWRRRRVPHLPTATISAPA